MITNGLYVRDFAINAITNYHSKSGKYFDFSRKRSGILTQLDISSNRDERIGTIEQSRNEWKSICGCGKEVVIFNIGSRNDGSESSTARIRRRRNDITREKIRSGSGFASG